MDTAGGIGVLEVNHLGAEPAVSPLADRVGWVELGTPLLCSGSRGKESPTHETREIYRDCGILQSMSLTPRVLIVEDDALTRSTMASALAASGLSVIGEAATAAAALRIFAESGADVALIDLDLGGGPTGIDLAVELRNRDANVGVIILTSYDDPRLLSSGLSSLPTGTIYLRKKQISSVQDVHKAIESAWHNPRSKDQSSEIRTHDLSDSNITLLREIASGMTNQQIAEAHGISVSAVEKSIRRLSKALGVNDSTGNPRALLIQSYMRMSGRDVGTTS